MSTKFQGIVIPAKAKHKSIVNNTIAQILTYTGFLANNILLEHNYVSSGLNVLFILITMSCMYRIGIGGSSLLAYKNKIALRLLNVSAVLYFCLVIALIALVVITTIKYFNSSETFYDYIFHTCITAMMFIASTNGLFNGMRLSNEIAKKCIEASLMASSVELPMEKLIELNSMFKMKEAKIGFDTYSKVFYPDFTR